MLPVLPVIDGSLILCGDAGMGAFLRGGSGSSSESIISYTELIEGDLKGVYIITVYYSVQV
jgi:hypothetical protein